MLVPFNNNHSLPSNNEINLHQNNVNDDLYDLDDKKSQLYDKDKVHVFRTDNKGLILPYEIFPENFNVLFLGGSTTESNEVNENYRFPFMIQKNLKERNVNVNIIIYVEILLSFNVIIIIYIITIQSSNSIENTTLYGYIFRICCIYFLVLLASEDFIQGTTKPTFILFGSLL